MSDQYMPTTDKMRESWRRERFWEIGGMGSPGEAAESARAEFDRWHQAELAKAWERGAESAFFSPDHRGQVSYPDNPYEPQP